MIMLLAIRLIYGGESVRTSASKDADERYIHLGEGFCTGHEVLRRRSMSS